MGHRVNILQENQMKSVEQTTSENNLALSTKIKHAVPLIYLLKRHA